jgi:hypothetical protein
MALSDIQGQISGNLSFPCSPGVRSARREHAQALPFVAYGDVPTDVRSRHTLCTWMNGLHLSLVRAHHKTAFGRTDHSDPAIQEMPMPARTRIWFSANG